MYEDGYSGREDMFTSSSRNIRDAKNLFRIKIAIFLETKSYRRN